jgi:hypothetical protein
LGRYGRSCLRLFLGTASLDALVDRIPCERDGTGGEQAERNPEGDREGSGERPHG